MMNDYISSLQKIAQQIRQLEECIQTYHYIQNIMPLLSTIEFPLEELIDSIICSDTALLTIHYFHDYPNALPDDCISDYQLLNDYYAKNKCAQSIFNTPYTFTFKHLKKLWHSAILNNNLSDCTRDLDQLCRYLQSYYSCRYQLHPFNYQELLSQKYGEPFFCSYYIPLLNAKSLLKSKYPSFLQANTLVPLHVLNFSKEQALAFFTYFIQQSTFITACYHIDVEFHQQPSCLTRCTNYYKISLAPYQNFVASLFEFLSLYAQIYAEVLKRSTSQRTKETQCILYCFQFLPIITPHFARFLADFLYRSPQKRQKARKVIYHELLARYLWLRPNPLQLHSVNPLSIFLTKMIELEIEELWLNQNINSLQLPCCWNQLSNYYFKRSPSHQMEASLRMTQWLSADIGCPFEQLVSLLNIFNYTNFHSHTKQSYEDFLALFHNGTILEFVIPHSLSTQELTDDSPIKSFLILLKQLQQQVTKH